MAEQTRDELIERAHAAVDWAAAFKADVPEPGANAGTIRFRARHVLRQLADAGLLHDHAECLEINQGWREYKHRKQVERAQLTADRDALQARIDATLTVLRQSLKPSAIVCDEAIAALQGDQPTESKPCKYVVSAWAGLPGSECIAFAEPGEDYCKPHGDAIKRLAEIPAAEPEVTPPDPSGRIVDGGPIQPFTDTDG